MLFSKEFERDRLKLINSWMVWKKRAWRWFLFLVNRFVKYNSWNWEFFLDKWLHRKWISGLTCDRIFSQKFNFKISWLKSEWFLEANCFWGGLLVGIWFFEGAIFDYFCSITWSNDFFRILISFFFLSPTSTEISKYLHYKLFCVPIKCFINFLWKSPLTKLTILIENWVLNTN